MLVADLCSDSPAWTSPSEVLALIRWLPDDSAFAASYAGGLEHRGWSQDRWMTKAVFDAIQTGTYVNMRIAAGKKGKSIPEPKHYPSPDTRESARERPKTPRTSVAALAAAQAKKG